MEVKALQKFIVSSPKKLREVSSILKDMDLSEIVEKLPLIGKRAGLPILKVIKTAMANAKQKGIDEASLYLKEIQILEGPRLKRGRAGARGRLKPYKRRMSHIRVVLGTKEKEVEKQSLQKLESETQEKLRSEKEKSKPEEKIEKK